MSNLILLLNTKGPNFKIGDHVIISSYKTIFLKNLLYLLLAKSKIQFHELSDLNGEKIDGIFIEKNCRRLIRKNLE